MSSQASNRATAYAEYVQANVVTVCRSGGGAYTYHELAEALGLKPTHNFKRRVKQMVEKRALLMVAAFTPRGGIEARFQSPDATQKELPF